MNKTIGDIHIAGSLTTDDWRQFRVSLTPGGDQTAWGKAFEEYFHTRLSLRYLGPIKVLQDNGSFQGEGFSIAAIQCSLIEFLESTVPGKSYRFLRKGAPTLGPYEYSSSDLLYCREESAYSVTLSSGRAGKRSAISPNCCSFSNWLELLDSLLRMTLYSDRRSSETCDCERSPWLSVHHLLAPRMPFKN